jgi:large subunit ribosomal protein L6
MRATFWLLSKLGRKPIKFTTAQVSKQDHLLTIKGPLGVNTLDLHPTVSIDVQPKQVVLNSENSAMWGTMRQLLALKIQGVEDGFTLALRMVGVGYRALIEDEKLSLKVGVSHPILLEIPQGVQVTIPAPQRIVLTGIDWPVITQFAAKIREFRKPEPYNQKGIFVGDETIKKKEGKKR